MIDMFTMTGHYNIDFWGLGTTESYWGFFFFFFFCRRSRDNHFANVGDEDTWTDEQSKFVKPQRYGGRHERTYVYTFSTGVFVNVMIL